MAMGMVVSNSPKVEYFGESNTGAAMWHQKQRARNLADLIDF